MESFDHDKDEADFEIIDQESTSLHDNSEMNTELQQVLLITFSLRKKHISITVLQDIRSFLLKKMLLKTLIFLFQSLYSGILDKHAPIKPVRVCGNQVQ